MILVRGDLGQYAGAWDDLVVTGPRPSPFLRSCWLNAVSCARTRIVLVVDGQTLLGGAAFEAERWHGISMLRFAGWDLSPDHMDIVAAPARLHEVLKGIAEWSTRRGTRVFDLRGIDDGNLVASALPDPVTQSVPSCVAPWGPLPASFEDYWMTRPGRLRNTVLRAERRLERSGATYETAPRDRADQSVEDFVRLHTLRWGDASALTGRMERFSSATRAALAAGEMVAHRLVVDERAIAIELWFEVGGVASFYQSGRDVDQRWRGSGSVLKARAIAGAHGRGNHEIDLLVGDEPYKRDWVEQERAVHRLRAAHGLVGRLALRASMIRGTSYFDRKK